MPILPVAAGEIEATDLDTALGILAEQRAAASDVVRLGAEADVLDAGVGDDRVSDGSGDDWLAGNRGDDRLYGGSGADKLIGNVGDDRLPERPVGRPSSPPVFLARVLPPEAPETPSRG